MGLMKKLTSGLVAASLVFGLVGTAFADMNDSNAVKAAADRMVALKVVDGVPGVGLDLGSNLTRAQVVKIIVAAYGQKDTAALLASAPSFSDVKGHWASGYIALAKAKAEQNGFTLGYPDGTFKPEGSITFAEVLGLLEKFMGVQATAGLSYPNNVIDAAVNAGLIDAKDKATVSSFPNAAITRGQAFYLADTAFSTKVNGAKSVYQTYDSSTQPSVTVDANSYTATTTATSVTIKGTVANATSLKVAGQDVTIAADGSWSATVALDKVGANTIAIEATDLIGNMATPASPVTITRNAGAAASIDASLSSATLTAGGTATLTYKVMDANGVELKDATATVTADAAIGTYDSTTATFTAAKVPATGNITITSGAATKTIAVTVTAGALDSVVASATSVAPGAKVTLTAKDANGNAITSGVTYSKDSADALLDQSGIFTAFVPGNYTVTATANGVSKTVKIGVYDNSAISSYGISFDKASLVANGSSTAKLTISALDKNGNVIANTTDAGSATVTSPAALSYSTDNGTTWATLNAAAISLTNGSATVLVKTSGATGGQTATVTVGTQSANLNLVDPVATTLKVTSEATSGFAPTDTTAVTKFDVDVLDQDGVHLAAGYVPVSLALNSGVAAGITKVGAASQTAAATGTAYYNGTVQVVEVTPSYVGATGPVVLTATATGLAQAQGNVTMQVPGYAAKLTVNPDTTNNPTAPHAGVAPTIAAAATEATPMTFKVQVTDAAGVPVGNTGGVDFGHVVATFAGINDTQAAQIFVSADGTANYAAVPATTYQVPVTVSNTDGTGTIKVYANNYTGPIAFTLSDTKTVNPLTSSAPAKFTVAPNAASKFSFTVNGNTPVATYNVAANGADVSYTAQVTDNVGNPTTYAGAKFTLTATTTSAGANANDVLINGAAATSTVTVDAAGKATFTVKAGSFVGATYTLTLTGSYVDSNSITQPLGAPAISAIDYSVVNTVASSISVGAYSNAGHTVPTSVANAGANTYFRATVMDNRGRKVAGEGIEVYPVNSDGTLGSLAASTAGATVTDNGDGTYDFILAPTVAPSSTFKVVTVSEATPAAQQFSITVKPDTAGGVKKVGIAGSSATQTVVSGQEKAITISLQDQYGNALVNATNSPVSITLAAVDHGTANASSNLQFRATSGGLSTATINVPAGAQSVTVYVFTTQASGYSFDVTVSSTGLTGATATFQVQ